MSRWELPRMLACVRAACGRVSLLAALAVVLVARAPSRPWAAEEAAGKPGYVRTVDGTGSIADLEKGERWSYNGAYLYALTRGVRDSSLPAAAKVVVFVPAFVVDTALLPVALIFGLFGG